MARKKYEQIDLLGGKSPVKDLSKKPREPKERTFTKAEVRELVYQSVGYAVGVADTMPKLTQFNVQGEVSNWAMCEEMNKNRDIMIRDKTFTYLEQLFAKVGI